MGCCATTNMHVDKEVKADDKVSTNTPPDNNEIIEELQNAQVDNKLITTDKCGIRHYPFEELIKEFNLADKDKSGTLDVDETIALMIKLGVKLNDTQRSEVEKLIRIADENNTKKLEFYEFKQFMYAVLNSPLKATVTFLFYVYDKDESGTIQQAELFRILKKAGSKATEQQVKEHMKQMKTDSNCVDIPTLKQLLIYLETQ
ncbi:EF_hand domain-containing protein [Hexamita inflata]|uniref:EF hand domain-containing protein n=1 Tax=Hexamita inflata TaxID=28002 RepID=A0AA86P7E0_9EUKA|nr:EF hand domain-containing protein [Hexamita inflata]CAI9932158.1 EF hand domain-containing protein [Hexamita inflata]